ncbi:MAG TPA: hypothetical protein VHF28_00070 [Nitrososphaera sp.]|jgi:uncharacterized CHY-type Zn-finger protein|nr:hypothetical protein [Nitrososphaera sp.]
MSLSKVSMVSEKDSVSCPYCASKFDSKEELSKHIDRIHSGAGLLEGDSRKW